MIVIFEKNYLRELYTEGYTSEKNRRYQPQIVKKYRKVIDLMKYVENVLSLQRYASLHYKHLTGDREGLSAVRADRKYRIEFKESVEEGKSVATICTITELSNHYQ